MPDFVAGNTVPLTYRSLRNGVATNTTPVQVSVYRPDAVMDGPYTLAAAQVVKTGTGQYAYSYPTTITHRPGQYVALWQSPLSVERQEFDLVRAVQPYPDVWNAISRKCAANDAPVLSNDDLDALVDVAVATTVPDVNKAAAEGWRLKAARVAGGFSFSADGVSVDKTMLMKHCLDMAAAYDKESKRSGGVYTVQLVLP
jgi:hypothetical protein